MLSIIIRFKASTVDFTTSTMPLVPSANTCNQNHHSWNDGTQYLRTCQEYFSRKLCTDSGNQGRKWRPKKFGTFGLYIGDSNFSARGCPQCGCKWDIFSVDKNLSCEAFNVWHGINAFQMKNYYVGYYYQLPDVQFEGKSVYKQKGRLVYVIYFDGSWVFTNLFKYYRFQE